MSVAEKLTTIAENQQKVYDAGYNKGKAEGGDTEAAYQEGLTAGIKQGKEAEWSAFWDAYQENGNRTNYGGAFTGSGWNSITFRPKYDIVLAATTSGSAFNNFGESTGVDLVKILDEYGVEIDFSKVYAAASIFNGANVTTLPPIYAPKWINWNHAWYGCSLLKAIDYTSASTVVANITNAFTNCTSLTDVTFTDTIIAANIDLHWSPLTMESLKSVMSALSKTITGLTASFNKKAVEAAFTTDAWNALVAEKAPNWTITLI